MSHQHIVINPDGTVDVKDNVSAPPDLSAETAARIAADAAEAAARVSGDAGETAARQAAINALNTTYVPRTTGEYHLTDYGTVDLTGVVSASATLTAALAAIYAGGGGTLIFPAGDILLASQVVIPNGNPNATGAPRQPSITWKGQGAHGAAHNELGSGGTRLILPFDGAAYNDAKIVTYGLGQWVIEDITFQDLIVGADTPFLYTTNTTLKVNRCAFIGASQDAACVQDAIVLGGKIKVIDTGYGDPDSAFQGYGTVIQNTYFNRIRRAVYGRSYCNQVQILANYMEKDCGTNLVGGAVIEIDGSLDPLTTNVNDVCLNNVVQGNYMHAIHYYYGVKIIKGSRNVVAFNGFIDAGANDITVARFEGITLNAVDHPSVDNIVIGNASQEDFHFSEDAISANRNYLFGGGATEGTILPGRVKQNAIGGSKFVVGTPAPGIDWKITDDTTNYFHLTQGAGGTWSVGGPMIFAGNAAGAGSTTVSIGNNSRASDATINLNAPTGQVNQIQFKRGGTNAWLLYDADSPLLFLRDNVSGVMALMFEPGVGVTGRVTLGGAITIPGELDHNGTTAGFYGATPVTQPAANPDTSGADLATLEAEVNQLKATLRSLGLLAT